MVLYPFILGVGLGVGVAAFVAANWDDIKAGIEAAQESRRMRLRQTKHMARAATSNLFDLDDMDVSDSDTETEANGSHSQRNATTSSRSWTHSTSKPDDWTGSGNLRHRNGNNSKQEPLFEMPTSGDSSISARSFTTYPADHVKDEPEIADHSDGIQMEGSGSEAILSSDDWSDAGKDVYNTI